MKLRFLSVWAIVFLCIFAGLLYVAKRSKPILVNDPPVADTVAQTTKPAEPSAKQEKTYKLALPGYQWRFPADHASHPAYKTEWWYYTGHLEASSKQANKKARRFGYQFTLFRSGSALTELPETSRWKLTDILVGHLAITDINAQRFRYEERFGRPGQLVGGANTDKLHVWLRDWSVTQDEQGRHILAAKSTDGHWGLSLQLEPSKPLVLQGKENGLSQKADCHGCASHYYSYTRMRSEGALTLDGETIPVTGQSWMDHEFGSNQLTKEQVGWDWFSVQLNDGSELMLYLIRQKNGQPDPNSSGTYIPTLSPSSTHKSPFAPSRYLPLKAFKVTPLKTWKSPKTKAVYPAQWRLQVPSVQLDLMVTPALNEQELRLRDNTGVTYWEGASVVSGTKNGKPIQGRAYVELTGYAEAFQKEI